MLSILARIHRYQGLFWMENEYSLKADRISVKPLRERMKMERQRTLVAALAEHLFCLDLLVYEPEGMNMTREVSQNCLLW